ncbi:unnamed protein product [Arctogadus glacialis]
MGCVQNTLNICRATNKIHQSGPLRKHRPPNLHPPAAPLLALTFQCEQSFALNMPMFPVPGWSSVCVCVCLCVCVCVRVCVCGRRETISVVLPLHTAGFGSTYRKFSVTAA